METSEKGLQNEICLKCSRRKGQGWENMFIPQFDSFMIFWVPIWFKLQFYIYEISLLLYNTADFCYFKLTFF